jgi:hypothetical protein
MKTITLDEWRNINGLKWITIARLLSEQCRGPIYEGRLNKLRRGSPPTMDELAALMKLTSNQCDSYS